MKVMVVDDHCIVREGVRALLEIEEDIEEVYEASSSRECFKVLEKYSPDVVLMDLKMPGVGGIEAVRMIKDKYPSIKVILLTNYDDQEFVIEGIRARADGYVIKDVKKEELPEIIRRVIDGNSYIDPTVTGALFRHLKNSGESAHDVKKGHLSQRELEILERVVDGMSNKEIADTLCLSLETVKSHLRNLYRKLGVCTRSQAIRVAIRQGWIHITN